MISLNEYGSNNAREYRRITGIDFHINNDFVDAMGGSASDIFEIIMQSKNVDDAYSKLPYHGDDIYACVREAWNDIRERELDNKNEWSMFLS